MIIQKPWLMWTERYKALTMSRLVRLNIPRTFHVLTFRAYLELKLPDLWIGVFWKFDKHECNWNSLGQKLKKPKGEYVLNVWICLVPCLPIHFCFVFYRNTLRIVNE